MLDTIVFLIICIITAVAAWFIARAHYERRSADRLAQSSAEYNARVASLEGRAMGAEALVNELRQQLEQRDKALADLRQGLDNERQHKVEALTRLEEAQRRLEDSFRAIEEQKTLISTMKTELADIFKIHASDALKSSNEDFLRLASEHLGKVVVETKGSLGQHQEAIDGTIRPLQDMLKRYEEQIQKIEKERGESYGNLAQQIRSLSSMQEQLKIETNNLVNVLRRPKVSGSWGEIGLKRVVELAGMTAYCDYFEQESVSTDTGRLRPDMIVRLPNSRLIVVDAKAPVDAYLSAVSAASEEARKAAMDKYIAQVRGHMNSLSSKAYWDQFEQSPEIVVMYLPGESFFSAALEHDQKLIEDSSAKKVILSTPTTFIALLKAIAYGWQQENVAKSARDISNLGKELYERFSIVLEHLSDIGNGIRKAVESYNKGVSSLENRLIPSIKRFKDLGISSQREIKGLPVIDQTVRDVGYLLPKADDRENRST